MGWHPLSAASRLLTTAGEAALTSLLVVVSFVAAVRDPAPVKVAWAASFALFVHALQFSSRMDTTQALKDAENALRDFIAQMLAAAFGQGWLEKCGVSPERILKWQERKVVEAKRQETGAVDERLLYYADFYDLKSILQKHWATIFSQALGDWKTIDVWLTELERLRDPDAHRRELLPHQHHLALGISGELRTRIVRFRSMQETSDSHFPRMETVRDSLGSMWTYGEVTLFHTGKNVHPGDTVDLVISASDPMGAPLQYGIAVGFGEKTWQDSNAFSYTFNNNDIGRLFALVITIRSPRAFHALGQYDDLMQVIYCVLPPRDR